MTRKDLKCHQSEIGVITPGRSQLLRSQPEDIKARQSFAALRTGENRGVEDWTTAGIVRADISSVGAVAGYDERKSEGVKEDQDEGVLSADGDEDEGDEQDSGHQDWGMSVFCE